jgi:hypothetical protein
VTALAASDVPVVLASGAAWAGTSVGVTAWPGICETTGRAVAPAMARAAPRLFAGALLTGEVATAGTDAELGGVTGTDAEVGGVTAGGVTAGIVGALGATLPVARATG